MIQENWIQAEAHVGHTTRFGWVSSFIMARFTWKLILCNVPWIMELSLPGTFVPWNEITLELSLPKWEKLQLTRICKRMTVAVDGQNCRSKNDWLYMPVLSIYSYWWPHGQNTHVVPWTTELSLNPHSLLPRPLSGGEGDTPSQGRIQRTLLTRVVPSYVIYGCQPVTLCTSDHVHDDAVALEQWQHCFSISTVLFQWPVR